MRRAASRKSRRVRPTRPPASQRFRATWLTESPLPLSDEQAIVKWQADHLAAACPICTAPFSLTTRKHHCRLCGRVVCFLPPSGPNQLVLAAAAARANAADPDGPQQLVPPTRRERCSTFFTYEYEASSSAEESEKRVQGVVVEVAPMEREELDLRAAMEQARGKAADEAKDERKKVRVCRECLNTVLYVEPPSTLLPPLGPRLNADPDPLFCAGRREQAKTLPVRTPPWLQLHAALARIEAEIDALLPEFQELILAVHNPSFSASDAHARPSVSATARLRQKLMTSLGAYDTVAKRVRELPLTDGGVAGGSQDRLQRAIATRAGSFLQEKLMLLRSLGAMEEGERKRAQEGRKVAGDGEPTVQTLASLLGREDPTKPVSPGGPGSEGGSQLAVLLE